MTMTALSGPSSTADGRLSRGQARVLLWWVAAGVGLVLPLHVAAWILASRARDWEVLDTARAANVSGLALLVLIIFGPLAFRTWSSAARQRGFVITWFVVSPFFNATWQLPLLVFKDLITNAPKTASNLPRFISWWGYGSIDSHYGTVSSFMVASELGWLVAMAIGLVGLIRLLRGDGRRALLILGISGALQAYNASFYLLENGIVDGFSNVATDSWMGPVLYVGFGALWPIAAVTASIICFRSALASPTGNSDFASKTAHSGIEDVS